ncbi:MAG: MerR family transcriptional regulator [Clostridia bacterium]|nr:MerR family transcriptional regulator [Clostridia bacterium]
MMTIKAFAELCGCTAQTLRYYDRIGLLRPAQVDKWTGYRYYEERQALDFVKIRNLQAADFAISEIELLLREPDEAVYAAFDAKIAAQEEKLQRIREIQRTYLREKNAMEKLLNGMIDYLLEGCRTPAVLREFGYEEADYDRVMTMLRTWLESTFTVPPMQTGQVALEVNGERAEGVGPVAEKLAGLPRDTYGDTVYFTDGSVTDEDGDYEPVWEKHGWSHPAELLPKIPPLTGEKPYELCVEVADFVYPKDLSYAMFFIGVLMLERGAFRCKGCSVERSGDGANHFVLKRRK